MAPPPHWVNAEPGEEQRFLVSGTCFEHAHFIGTDTARMNAFTSEVLELTRGAVLEIYAWCV